MHQWLDRISLFDILDPHEKQTLAGKLEPRSYKLGQTICGVGEKADALYFIASGKVRVVGTKPDGGGEMTIGLHGEGEHFGEESLLSDVSMEFTVRAAGPADLLRLSKEDFLGLLKSYPELEKYFVQYLSQASMRVFLKKSTVLAPIRPIELRSLLDRIRLHEFEPGEDIVREGDEGDSFYIIRSGEVHVLKEGLGIVNRLQPGAFFGELALLTGAARAATVRAAEAVTAFRLSREHFNELIAQYPQIKNSILSITAGYGSDLRTEAHERVVWEEAAATAGSVLEEQWVSVEEKRGKPWKPKRSFRLPVVLQQSMTDCGAACLAMVCRFYRMDVSLSRLREWADVNRDGAALYGLAEAGERLGFATRGIQTDWEGLKKQELPAIAHWQGNHYIVLYRIQGDVIVGADPALGLRKLTKDELLKNWTGALLLLTPTPRTAEVRTERSGLGKYLPYFKPYRRTLLDIFVASLFLQLFAMTMPFFTQTIIDRVLVYQDASVLNMVITGMVLISLFSMLITAARQFLVSYMGKKIDNQLIIDFYRHLLALPLKFFQTRHVGDIISRVNENQKIRKLITSTLITTVLDALSLLVFLSILFYSNAKLALVPLAFIPLYALLTLGVTPLMKRIGLATFHAESTVQSHMVEAVSSIATVKGLAAEKIVQWKLEDKLEQLSKAQMSGLVLGVAAGSVNALLQMASGFLVLLYGAHLVLGGEFSVGQLMAFTMLTAMITGPLFRFLNVWNEIQDVNIAMERLNDIYETEAEEAEPERTVVLPNLKGSIRFEQVNFRYQADGRFALQNISLDIAPGQQIALVGRSGSGKSTLASLLLRMYSPTSGKITIDGYDLKHANLASLRRQIGVVQQDNVLFSGTIRDNIAYHFPDATFEEVQSAATLAGAHAFIQSLPLGYDTVIGERGMSLSGGQRQRIAIARALIGKPRILIFDEATSALDTESERIIQRNMDMILKDRTTIVIAHRLSTIRKADLIVVLDQGTIAESGTHEQLMESKGLYYYLHSQQLEQ